jgi:hypothetical protein
MSLEIKFSHIYPKLHGQTSAQLVSVNVIDRKDMSPELIEYDTKFDGGYYPLPAGIYLILLFHGNLSIPFTTIRRWTEEKQKYYWGSIGKIFNIKFL